MQRHYVVSITLGALIFLPPAIDDYFARAVHLGAVSFAEKLPLTKPTLSSVTAQFVVGEKLAINRATEGELVLLPHIGPKLAQAILRERRRRGRFSDIRQLLSIRGIGPKIFARLRPLVSTAD